MSDVLVRICDQKRQHVAERKAEKSEQNQLDMARQAPPPRGFADALDGAVADCRFGLIAEIKKASPSHGLIRADFDPPAHAVAYAADRQEGGEVLINRAVAVVIQAVAHGIIRRRRPRRTAIDNRSVDA